MATAAAFQIYERRLESLSGLSGLAPGGEAVQEVPTKYRVHGFNIFCAAKLKDGEGNFTVDTTDPTAILKRVEVWVNSRMIRNLTPLEYMRIAKIDADRDITDHVPIYFTKPDRRTTLGSEATALVLSAGARNCELKYILKGTDEISAPSIETQMEYDESPGTLDAEGRVMLDIEEYLTQTIIAPQGELTVTNLPVGTIRRMHFQPSAGTISEVTIEADGVERYKRQKNAMIRTAYKKYDIDSPFDMSVVFDYNKQLASSPLICASMRNTFTFSEANSCRVIIERRRNSW